MKKSLFVLVALAVTATAMLALSGTASAAGVTQVSGLGTFPNPGEDHCTNGALLAVADYLINLEGDLEGCVYGGVTAGSATGSGVSKTWSTEIFDGCWNGACGTFDMLGNIQAKEGPGAFGFCVHPIVKGTGTGGLAGITGRLDFRDDLEAGDAPYTGHLKLG